MGHNTRQAYDKAAAFYDAEPNSVLFTETGAVLGILAAGPGAGLAPAGEAEIVGDSLLEGILAPEYLAAAQGSPLILAMKFVKTT